MVFVFGSVYVVNYIYRLAYVEPALHPRDESYLIMMDKFFGVLLQSACQYLTDDFCIYVHYGYWPEVFLPCPSGSQKTPEWPYIQLSLLGDSLGH